MSFGKLSTELDARIVEVLDGDTKALSAFSQVSKYYRAIAEPYLYSNIECSGEDRYTLLQLLLTLLDRNSLASHIKSIVLHHGPAAQVPSGEKVDEVFYRLWNKVDIIRDLLAQYTGMDAQSGSRARSTTQWAGRLFAQESCDPTLSLLLCLAKSIERLRIRDRNMCLRTVLQCGWSNGQRLMTKLKHLSIRGDGVGTEPVQFLLPSMVTLEIDHCVYSSVSLFDRLLIPEAFPGFDNTALRALVLRKVDIRMDMLANSIRSPWLANLKVLRICGRRYYYEDDDLIAHRSVVLRALEGFVPNLECFEWSAQYHPGETIGLTAFKNWKHLRKLHVDFNLLVPSSDNGLEALSDPQALFPDSLRSLHLDSISRGAIDTIVSRRHEASPLINTLLTSLRIEELTLSVILEVYDEEEEEDVRLLELEYGAVATLRSNADRLSRIGKTLMIKRAPGQFTKFYKYLMGPGWTAPFPHSRFFFESPIKYRGRQYTSNPILSYRGKKMRRTCTSLYECLVNVSAMTVRYSLPVGHERNHTEAIARPAITNTDRLRRNHECILSCELQFQCLRITSHY